LDKIRKPILDVLAGRKPQHIPVWLMRQAGRYLPEYRALRAEAGNFLKLCLNPDYAAEITLQPIRRFGMDAAILFADILLVPMAMGVALEFREGEGPVLEKVTSRADIEKLSYDAAKVSAVFETVKRVKRELPETCTLIGFCGAPWTVAAYMVDGNSKNDFAMIKSWLRGKPELLRALISKLIEASEEYLSAQIEVGAEAVQIFDSWAGLVSGDDFKNYIIEPTTELVRRLKQKHPDIPIIGFPREAGQYYVAYLRETGVDAASIDYDIDLATAQNLQKIKPLQGNLHPDLVVKGGDEMIEAMKNILTELGPVHIANLGHGVVPQTPPEHVGQLVKFVQGFKI
jgi:uroporphyrinogen decarboxylase